MTSEYTNNDDVADLLHDTEQRLADADARIMRLKLDTTKGLTAKDMEIGQLTSKIHYLEKFKVGGLERLLAEKDSEIEELKDVLNQKTHDFKFASQPRKPYKEQSRNGGIQKLYLFSNGYGASVVRHNFSYGGEKGLWELAVTLNGDLCYDTPVTDDVIGHLSDTQVEDLLDEIEALPAEVKIPPTHNDDIVTRLRLWETVNPAMVHVIEDLHKAADEIEDLRSSLAASEYNQDYWRKKYNRVVKETTK